MKVIVYNDRSLNVIYEYSTQNENDFEVMEFKFSSIFDNYNKKIVFLTPDGNISYYINNNKFSIPREITQYDQVKFYIWCTFEDKDFRTKLKILSFYKNENVNIDILPLEKAQIEEIINELEKNILIVQNLEKQTTNLIDEIETKLKNGDFVGPQGPSGPPGPPGPQGDPGESYDDTEIKEEISDIKEEQTTQNTRIEELEEQVQELENNQLTGTATGQSIYIEDSTNTKVRSIGLSGNSEQDGTPTPENPVEIHSTGDSGSVNEKVQNKNLFDKSTAIVGAINKNTGAINTNDTLYWSSDFIEVKPNNGYSNNISVFRSDSYGFALYDRNKNYITGITATNNISVPNNDNIKYLRFCFRNETATNYPTDINIVQLEQGSTATDYIAHAEQNISFPLSQGQKFMQGDYLADDGIHHVMGEVVFDGTESWDMGSNVYLVSPSIKNVAKATLNSKCNIATVKTISSLSPSDVNKYAVHTPSSNSRFWFRCPQFNTVAEWEAYLTDNPITIQYELAEEVIDPYTEEQQEVWEQIKALRTYKPVTHISSTDEVPATVNVTYVKDLETVINNLGG